MALNEQNLIPNSERSPEEVRENGKKGGIASGQKRRELKLIKDLIKGVRKDQPIDPLYTGIALLLSRITSSGTETKDLVKALEFLRDTCGEKPKEQVSTEIIGSNISMIEFVEETNIKPDESTTI